MSAAARSCCVAARIAHPMDLTSIAEKMASGAYRTVKEFVADLRLVFTNCIDYWTPTVDYAIAAQYLLNEVDLRVKEMTFELTTGATVIHAAGEAGTGSKAKGGKKAAKQHKNSAVTAWTPAMQQAAAAVVTGGNNKDHATTTPSTPSTPMTPSSFGSAGSPPADFPTTATACTSFPSVMSNAEYSKCSSIVHSLQSDSRYGLFAKPANIPEFAALLSDYYVKVRHPNDLQTVSRRLAIRDYSTVDEFRADVALIWENALSYYNKPGLNEQLLDADELCKLALQLRDDFNHRWHSFEQTAANKLVIRKSKAAIPTLSTAAMAGALQPSPQVKSERVAVTDTTDSATRRLTADWPSTATTATVGDSKDAAVMQVKSEGEAHPVHGFAAASIGSSITSPTASTALSAASGGEVKAAGASLAPSSSLVSHAPASSLSVVGDKRVKKSPGNKSAALPLPPPASNATARPASPMIAPSSPASLHRASQSQPLANNAGTNRASPPHATSAASTSQFTITVPSSRRHDSSAGSSASAAASLWSSVRSDVLPPPPKAKQRGGSVIKPLTAAQRKVRVSEVSQKVAVSASRTQQFWQQHSHTTTAQPQQHVAQQAAASQHSANSRSIQTAFDRSLQSTIDKQSFNLLPTPLLPATHSPPLVLPPAPHSAPAASSIPSEPLHTTTAVTAAPPITTTRSCQLPVEVPMVSSTGLHRYTGAGFHRCGPGGFTLCRARHCLLPATIHFPYHIDSFTVELAALSPSALHPSSTSTVPVLCELSDRVGGCSVVLPSTARAVECSAGVALRRKRRRLDAATAASSLLAPLSPSTVTAGVDRRAADSLSAFTCRLFPPLSCSDREQLKLLPSRLSEDENSTVGGAARLGADVSDTVVAAMADEELSVDDAGEGISHSLSSHGSLAAVYAPLSQLTAALEWHSEGFWFCREQASEKMRHAPLASVLPSSRATRSSRRRYLSCHVPSHPPLPAEFALPFGRLSVFCFAATMSVALPGHDTLLASPLHVDGCTLAPRSVCRAWEQLMVTEQRNKQQQISEQLRNAIVDAERSWQAMKDMDRSVRDKLGLLVS